MIAKIKNEENVLMEKIKQNPEKWSSKSLKVKINSSESTALANVGVEFLKFFSEVHAVGPFNRSGYQIFGELSCFQSIELSYEFKLDAKDGTFLSILIGSWFGLVINVINPPLRYKLRLKLENGLFNDKSYQDTTNIEYPYTLEQWKQEICKKYL